jgi:hypothetical protein
MKRAILFSVIALSAAVGIACEAGQPPVEEQKAEIEVIGCLTGSGDQFALTELERSDANTNTVAPATETYQLVGDNNQLRQHVGKQVKVAGMADTPTVAIVRESSPAAPAVPPAAGTTGEQSAAAARPDPAAGPKVSTQEQTRLEVARLNVRTISVVADRCTP